MQDHTHYYRACNMRICTWLIRGRATTYVSGRANCYTDVNVTLHMHVESSKTSYYYYVANS